MNFDIHHIAYLTENIESAVNEMSALGFTLESPIYDIISQKVRVCFLRNKENICYELVEPYVENFTLRRLISNGVTIYHTGYLVSSIEGAKDYLKEKGFYLVSIFHSEAFDERRCAFFVSRSKNLIELIEK
ncbi:VOC family protein [Schleiferiaceae bacterium]|nr:VOC family protein [Schleiferiaceae bacterium]